MVRYKHQHGKGGFTQQGGEPYAALVAQVAHRQAEALHAYLRWIEPERLRIEHQVNNSNHPAHHQANGGCQSGTHHSPTQGKDENPIEYAQRKEKEEVVSNAIASLPSEDLRVVARMFANSCSFTEIGEALGISKQAAHKKWLKTKELLRLALQDYWDSINS